jgi:betaine-aldehyde dehydrogenase
MSEIARHWIDGEWVRSGTVSESINPATGAVLGRWADGGEAEARAAIAVARRAFDTASWSRDRVLRHWGPERDGRPLRLSRRRAGRAGDEGERARYSPRACSSRPPPGGTLRHNAADALIDTGISAEVAPGQWFSTYAEPAGVVGIIVPWNAPVALLIRSLAPALSAGNTVAVKMPGQTALVANLVASPDVQVISYTGSTAVGRLVAADGAPTLKRMNLELGGKTPMIVFDDADLDATVPLLAAGITTFARCKPAASAWRCICGNVAV